MFPIQKVFRNFATSAEKSPERMTRATIKSKYRKSSRNGISTTRAIGTTTVALQDLDQLLLH